MLENINRKDKNHILLLEQNGVFIQQAPYDDLKGAHWNKAVRGMTIVAFKNLIDQVDKHMVEDLAQRNPRRVENKQKERLLKNKKWRNLEK